MEFFHSSAIDFSPNNGNATIIVKQSDTCRKLEMEPRFCGEKIDIRSLTVKLYAERADHVVIVQDCDINTSGNACADITEEMTTVPGIIRCDLKLIDDNDVISSAVFYIQSVKSVLRSNVIMSYRNRAFSRIIKVFNQGEIYEIENDESLLFGLKRAESDECILQKVLTTNQYVQEKHGYLLQLSSQEMCIPEGEYKYDVALRRSGQLLKVIQPTRFRVIGSVVEG